MTLKPDAFVRAATALGQAFRVSVAPTGATIVISLRYGPSLVTIPIARADCATAALVLSAAAQRLHHFAEKNDA